MRQSIATVALVVRDYDEALAFYVGTLGFTLIEDTAVNGSSNMIRETCLAGVSVP